MFEKDWQVNPKFQFHILLISVVCAGNCTARRPVYPQKQAYYLKYSTHFSASTSILSSCFSIQFCPEAQWKSINHCGVFRSSWHPEIRSKKGPLFEHLLYWFIDLKQQILLIKRCNWMSTMIWKCNINVFCQSTELSKYVFLIGDRRFLFKVWTI